MNPRPSSFRPVPLTATPLGWRATRNAPTQRCLKSAISRLRDGPSIGYVKMERHFPWPLLTSSKGFKKLFRAQKLPQLRHSTPLFCKTGRTIPLDRDDNNDHDHQQKSGPPFDDFRDRVLSVSACGFHPHSNLCEAKYCG